MNILREAPPWYTGWIALAPMLFFGGVFLYFGMRYKKTDHEKTISDERQPEIFRKMPWWFLKLFLIVLGLFILGAGIGYMINVPEDFF